MACIATIAPLAATHAAAPDNAARVCYSGYPYSQSDTGGNTMSQTSDEQLSEYMIISKGQWDEDKSPEQIQQAIDAFYVWRDQLVAAGRMKSGQRLSRETKVVSRHGITDGPFAETKEVIGGYWFFMARSLEEAAALVAQSPCLACGLSYEVRPTDPERCSAYDQTSETPPGRRARA